MKITTTIERDFTPKELAAAFWEMNVVGKAEFFNELFEVAKGDMNFNWATKSLSSWLTLEGVKAIQLLAANLDEIDETDEQ